VTIKPNLKGVIIYMRNFSGKLIIAYILIILVAVIAVAGVMRYWYGNTFDLHKLRLREIVSNKKVNLQVIFLSHIEKHRETSNEAFHSAVLDMQNGFASTIGGDFSSTFALIVKDGTTFYSVYKNIDGQSFLLKEPIGDVPEGKPVSLAYEGERGVTVKDNIYGEKLLVAYDFVDLGDRRVVLTASVPYVEVIRPRSAAIISGLLICVVMFVGGGLMFYLTTRKNISDLRIAHSELEAFGHIMNSAKELISYVGLDHRYYAVNDAYESVFEVPKESIVGVHMRDFHGSLRYDGYLKVCLDKCVAGEDIRSQNWYELSEGRRRYLDINFTPHYSKGEIAGFVITANDITELENAKQEILETSRDLEKLTLELEEKVKEETTKRIQHEQLFFEQKKFADMGQMINAIAHQWRQPLNALGLYIQYIIDCANDEYTTPELLEGFKNDSMNLVQHLSKTIDDFRAFFEPGKAQSEFEVVNAVTETVSLVDAQLHNNFIEYEINCTCDHKDFAACNGSVPLTCSYPMTQVSGYPSEFKQVLMNIIQNAKDALIHRCSGRKLFIGITGGECEVMVDVTDNGGGIPKSVLGKVFDPYFTTKEEGKGTGIGLYMSKLIIEDHMKGALAAYNTPDGAGFKIILKRVPAKG